MSRLYRVLDAGKSSPGSQLADRGAEPSTGPLGAASRPPTPNSYYVQRVFKGVFWGGIVPQRLTAPVPAPARLRAGQQATDPHRVVGGSHQVAGPTTSPAPVDTPSMTEPFRYTRLEGDVPFTCYYDRVAGSWWWQRASIHGDRLGYPAARAARPGVAGQPIPRGIPTAEAFGAGSQARDDGGDAIQSGQHDEYAHDLQVDTAS